MKVYVDADSCAVKEEVVRVAECHDLAIVLVLDQLGRWPRSHLIVCVLLSDGVEVAEDWIVERIGVDDICVTQDIQLAKCCLDAGAQVIGATGSLSTKRTAAWLWRCAKFANICVKPASAVATMHHSGAKTDPAFFWPRRTLCKKS